MALPETERKKKSSNVSLLSNAGALWIFQRFKETGNAVNKGHIGSYDMNKHTGIYVAMYVINWKVPLI